MKILFVIDSLGSGGAQNQLVKIANYFSNFFDVTIFLYNPVSNFLKKKISPKIKIYKVKNRKKNGFSFKVLRDLKSFMDKNDVVISFLLTANIYVAIASLVSNKAKRICVEKSIANRFENIFQRFLANLACMRAHHIICNSFTQKKYLSRIPGVKKKLSVIWNGYSKIFYQFKSHKYYKKSYFIIVGRIAFPKNGVRFLESIKIFHERNKFLPKFLWIGRSDTSSQLSISMKKQMILFLANNPKIKKNFKIIGEVKNVKKFYKSSNALILPSIIEGLPNVICEAMIYGCPVIASRVSDNEIILQKKETRGLLFNPLSPLDICLAIERYYKISFQDIKKMTRRAHSYAIKNFSLSKMLSKYIKVTYFVTKN